MKILILGANGMLGNSIYRYFRNRYEVKAVSRSKSWTEEVVSGYDINDISKFSDLIEDFKPQVVVNCIGIIKQLKDSKNSIKSIATNSLWPHQLVELCAKSDTKVIHFSTDCVFDGKEGSYTENDKPNSQDLYGLSKRLGELTEDKNALTLRTSIIGHELNSSVSLIDWFLSQDTECQGFKKAIYSGFPTISIAKIIDKYILKALLNNEIYGLYHLSSEPISKFELLNLVAKEYGKEIDIKENNDFIIDRSLDSSRLQNKLNFSPNSWENYIKEMYTDFLEISKIRDNL
ncbi:dTDP-4-dehydrorhamnose reductase family protein [Halobacteriovorax sp.]|uniref:dTDP-4-dehydrorhamnose reductase family protein n=1 Tax=Halobacteriovorax sp. TaxID=2020862 RepID=UPI003AF2AB89